MAAVALGVYLVSRLAPGAIWAAVAVKGALLALFPALLVRSGFLRDSDGRRCGGV